MRKFLHVLNTLQIGDRLVVPKSNFRMVQHHAIFLGFLNGHYWFIENKESFGVRIVTAEVFFVGVDEITRIVKFVPKVGYSRRVLSDYALSKKGKGYNLVSYNCEHFANEVQNRVIKSHQADTGVALGMLAGLVLLIAIGSTR